MGDGGDVVDRFGSLSAVEWVDGDIIRILYGKYNLHFGRLMVTPSANRNSYRVAKVVRDDTQGRGAAHLNPGLGKRNSITFPRRTRRAGDLRFRVAAACGLLAQRRRGVHHPLLCPALPALLFATPLLLLASPAPPLASRRLSRSIAMPALRSAPSQLDAKSPSSSLGLR